MSSDSENMRDAVGSLGVGFCEGRLRPVPRMDEVELIAQDCFEMLRGPPLVLIGRLKSDLCWGKLAS